VRVQNQTTRETTLGNAIAERFGLRQAEVEEDAVYVSAWSGKAYELIDLLGQRRGLLGADAVAYTVALRRAPRR
jgi:hypothetical protein